MKKSPLLALLCWLFIPDQKAAFSRGLSEGGITWLSSARGHLGGYLEGSAAQRKKGGMNIWLLSYT